jgi:hypothetical protein
VAAVEARLESLWDRCPIVGVNLKNEAPPGTPHLLVEYPVAEPPLLMTEGNPGANVWREEGAFRLVLHRPRDEGIMTGLQWAEDLAGLFLGKEFDGVQTFGPTSPAIDDRNTAGPFCRFSIAVPYQHDFVG